MVSDAPTPGDRDRNRDVVKAAILSVMTAKIMAGEAPLVFIKMVAGTLLSPHAYIYAGKIDARCMLC